MRQAEFSTNRCDFFLLRSSCLITLVFFLLGNILILVEAEKVGQHARVGVAAQLPSLSDFNRRFFEVNDLVQTVRWPLRESVDNLFFLRLQRPECINGGEARDDVCICPIYYTGTSCSERQCPNSMHGKGPYRILPVNPANKFCDHCDVKDFEGLNCQLCRRDAACGVYGGNNSRCDRTVVIRGNSKQFQCHLKPSYFVDLMGNGRNISVEIMLNCSTQDRKAFNAGQSGECHMTLYRIESEREFVDPFFRCKTSECTMRYATRPKIATQAKTKTWVDAVFAFVRVGGRVVLLGLCAAMVLLGWIARRLSYKRLKRLTMMLGGLLCGGTMFYILLMVLSMWMTDLEEVVVYECKTTSCACAEDPPKQYRPWCSETDLLVNQVLPSIRNSVRIECEVETGKCQLTLNDIMLVFDVDCQAAECVDDSQFPSSDESGTDANTSKLLVLLKFLFAAANLSLIGVVLHWVYLRKCARKRVKEFRLFFSVNRDTRPPAGTGQGDQGEVDGASVSVTGGTSQGSGLASSSAIAPHREYAAVDTNPTLPSDELPMSARVPLLETYHNQWSRARDFVGRMLLRKRQSRLAGSLAPSEVDEMRALMRSPIQLRVEGLQYALPNPSFSVFREDPGVRIILHQIHFTVRSGDVLAIMGPSGAGKTTLLDLLSLRSKSGLVYGEVLLNGSPVSTTGEHAAEYRNIIGYVSQEDTLLPSLTVRQTLEYAARLKLPTAFSNHTIADIVDRMIQRCRLEACENTMVGGNGVMHRISGGERRRVCVAVELLANPRILFLDEPTSGLDAVNAKRMIEAIVKLAKDSSMRAYAPHFFAFDPIVVFSIHQPSKEIYSMFDKVLLLSKGMSVYCGPASEAASTLEERVHDVFGSTRAMPLRTEHGNEAEYLMKLEELLDDNVRLKLLEQDLRSNSARHLAVGEWWVETAIAREDVETRELAEGHKILKTAAYLRVYYMNIYEQLGLLTSRSITCLFSSFHLIMCHAAVVVCMAVLMCSLYKEQMLDLSGALNREGSVSFLLLVTSFVCLSCLEHLIVERKLFIVERENGFYCTLPYLISKLVVDVFTLRIIPAVVLSSSIYFSMGFRTDSGEHFLWFILIITLFSVCMTLIVMCIGIVMESFGASALVSSVFILWFFVFGGCMVQVETIPNFLKPFKSISPFFLSFESLMINELDGQSCVFSPTDETGKPSPESISIQCRQYLFNVGLKPPRFSTDVIEMGLICFLLVLVAWVLLANFTKLVR